MRSVKATVSVPTALEASFEKRVKELGYPSISAYFISLGIYDLLVAKPHELTGDVHKHTLPEQDKMHDDAARHYLSGKTIGGSWYSKVHEKAVKLAGKEPDRAQLKKQLWKQIACQ